MSSIIQFIDLLHFLNICFVSWGLLQLSAHRLHLIEQINNVILCGKCGLNHHHREVKRRCACKKVVEDSEPQHEPYSDDDNKEGDNEDKDSNGIDDEIVRIAV